MPLVYTDTSALFAYFNPDDEFSGLVDAAAQEVLPDFIYWSFLRYELRHNLRMARAHRYGEVAWRALRAAEKTAARLRWQSELSMDLMLETAEALGAQISAGIYCSSSDYIHVAAALRVNGSCGLDAFWTCDSLQTQLASKLGLKTRLFEIPPRCRVSPV